MHVWHKLVEESAKDPDGHEVTQESVFKYKFPVQESQVEPSEQVKQIVWQSWQFPLF